MEIKLPKGQLRITAMSVEAEALRIVLECFARMIGLPTGTSIWIRRGIPRTCGVVLQG